MTGVFTTAASLWIVGGIFAVAVALLMYVILVPGFRISRERRRSLLEQGGLEGVLDAAANALGKSKTQLRWIAEPLDQAGFNVDPGRVALALIAAELVATLVGLLGGGIPLALLLVVAVPMVARLIVSFIIGRRRSAFADQLDEGLQMLAASLRAGYGLLQAFNSLALDSEEPSKGEFTRLVNETRVGIPIGVSLDNMAARLDNEDFKWVGQAIAINREVGGNLADVLDGVAGTIRERNNLRRQVKTLSAEGKLSAVILYALPIVFGLAMAFINPKYISVLFSTVYGFGVLGAALVLMAVGGVWLRSIVQIKY